MAELSADIPEAKQAACAEGGAGFHGQPVTLEPCRTAPPSTTSTSTWRDSRFWHGIFPTLDYVLGIPFLSPFSWVGPVELSRSRWVASVSIKTAWLTSVTKAVAELASISACRSVLVFWTRADLRVYLLAVASFWAGLDAVAPSPILLPSPVELLESSAKEFTILVAFLLGGMFHEFMDVVYYISHLGRNHWKCRIKFTLAHALGARTMLCFTDGSNFEYFVKPHPGWTPEEVVWSSTIQR